MSVCWFDLPAQARPRIGLHSRAAGVKTLQIASQGQQSTLLPRSRAKEALGRHDPSWPGGFAGMIMGLSYAVGLVGSLLRRMPALRYPRSCAGHGLRVRRGFQLSRTPQALLGPEVESEVQRIRARWDPEQRQRQRGNSRRRLV